jgi:carboxyl-terminal processing protease
MTQKLKIFRLALLVTTAILAVLMLVVNQVNRVSAREDDDSDVYRHLKTFSEVLAIVQKNYVENVDIQSLVEGSLKGMLFTLDPHSGYMSKEVYNELKVETKGEFGGLGIEITVKDGLLTVVAAIEDSPAFKAGIQTGDQIIKIGDMLARDLSLVDAVRKMRGAKGTPITLYVHRKSRKDLVPIEIVRDVIRVKSVKSRSLGDGLIYVRLTQFQEDSADEFLKALSELKKGISDKTVKGLVLDLRNDPGGLLNQATRISDLFLKDGLITYTEGRLESQKQKFYAHDDGNEPTYPVVILVNGGSASASEIVAGALQDARRALIVGTQTFGKGSVQTILPLDNGGALRLTTALYFTRGGRSIQSQGVTPDVIVEDPSTKSDEDTSVDSIFPRKEKDLPGALKNPQQNGNKEESAAQVKKDATNAKDSDRPKSDTRSEINTKIDPKKDGSGSDRILPGSREALTLPLERVLADDPQLAEAIKILKADEVEKRMKPEPPPTDTVAISSASYPA